MTAPGPSLAWNRSDANRRDTRLLLALFALILFPVALYVGQYLTEVIAIALLTSAPSTPGTPPSPGRILPIAAVNALVILLIVVALEFRFASRFVLKFSGAQPVTREEEPELWRLVENLCIGTGLPEPQVCVIESEATNALSTGLEPGAASIVVTRGLLDLLERRELEGVVAQELSQIGNRDTRLKTVVAALVATLWLPARIIVRIFAFLFGINWLVGIGCLVWLGFPLIGGLTLGFGFAIRELDTNPAMAVILLGAMLLPVYAFVVAPIAGLAIRAALARERTLLADADAVLLTRDPRGLEGALSRIREAGREALEMNPALAHLFLVDPRPGGEATSGLRRTHPPLDERIDRLRSMGGPAHSAG